MHNDRPKTGIYLGAFLIGIGLIFNKWILELLFSTDGSIGSPPTQALIAIVQFLLIGFGVYCAIRNPRIEVPSRRQIGLLVASTLLSVVLIEITLRVWLTYFSTAEQYRVYAHYTDIRSEDYYLSPHHYLNYYPTPNYRDGLTYHNSLGYRSREFNSEKPPNVYRIALIGGSTTYTVSVQDNEKTFPYQLERILRDDYGHHNVEVINAGVSGYNSWESLINLQFRVLDINPDLVIVYHATNDVHARLVEPGAYRGDNSGRRKQWSLPCMALWDHSVFARFAGRNLGLSSQIHLETVITSSNYVGLGGKETGNMEASVELLRKNPPIYFRRNLNSMVSVARENEVSLALATWAHSPYFGDFASTDPYQLGFKEHNEVVKEVADESGAYLFEFASLMPTDRKYWADGRHVNEEGAVLKAQLFAKFIQGSGVIGE